MFVQRFLVDSDPNLIENPEFLAEILNYFSCVACIRSAGSKSPVISESSLWTVVKSSTSSSSVRIFFVLCAGGLCSCSPDRSTAALAPCCSSSIDELEAEFERGTPIDT